MGEISDEEYYENWLAEDHVMHILRYEFTCHNEYFSEENYEVDPWNEEGMAKYISRWELLTEAEFAEKTTIERLLVELVPRFCETIPALRQGLEQALLVALRLVNTIPLPKIARGPPQNLRGRGCVLSRLMGYVRGKSLFCLLRPNY